ncbi:MULTISPECIES: hypothetical protein [unclassified Streptomyces]|uniref:hypothetical protein n=1 Tax=unclassified Streptomyces TaxID=2593676 RepID=UPI003D902ECF
MGSLRNPVGPLPSSIYWRRRAVLLSMVALLALLIAWVVTATGGGGGKNGADGSNGKHPTSSITPGPSGTGPAISQHPGGRDESSGGGSGSSPGSSGSGGSGDTGSGSGGADGGASGGGDGGSSGGQLSAGAGSSLPNCTSGAVTLTLKSVHNSYAPGDTPTFELTAKNSSGGDCKVDLGPKTAVLTITQTGSDDDIWSSSDCPSGSGSLLFRVPANSEATYTVKWDRKQSAPNCATPPAGSASAGTYLVEVQAPGFPKVQTSFVLSQD